MQFLQYFTKSIRVTCLAEASNIYISITLTAALAASSLEQISYGFVGFLALIFHVGYNSLKIIQGNKTTALKTRRTKKKEKKNSAWVIKVINHDYKHIIASPFCFHSLSPVQNFITSWSSAMFEATLY